MPNINTPRLQYSSTAVRPYWDDLPRDVRQLISLRLGGVVNAGPSAGSGFTRGFAAVVTADSGPQFVKAVNSADSMHIADCYRREALINRALPDEVPAPRLRWHDEQDGWVVLGFDAITGGHLPSEPWQPEELAAALAAWASASEALAEPSEPLLLTGLLPVGESGDFADWRTLAAGTTTTDLLPNWAPLHLLDTLANLEAGWREATKGDAVLHHDLRQDNILLDTAGSAWICDWNWPCLGASWFDLVLLLATAYADGHDASALFAAHPTTREVADEQLDAALAALSGFFLLSGARPPHAFGSPYLRQHQTWSGEVTLRWLADRRGWRF
ncbi:phosphotransferase family protein [Streptomyces sp. NPDC006704]|uniref:phosphotransferase family protein n=1 Tax=Streptomyces sp. NPDC006704 TaxID=3364760 RepID=UPI0036CB45D2